uniref:Uncharacterized protein n=1 Tax=Oryza rufipogon TaxID=4529 RepID=A0A0E0QGS9_ORYRU
MVSKTGEVCAFLFQPQNSGMKDIQIDRLCKNKLDGFYCFGANLSAIVKCPHSPLPPAAAAAAGSSIGSSSNTPSPHERQQQPATTAERSSGGGGGSSDSRQQQHGLPAATVGSSSTGASSYGSQSVASRSGVGGGCDGEIGGMREKDGNSDGSGMVPILEIFSGI